MANWGGGGLPAARKPELREDSGPGPGLAGTHRRASRYDRRSAAWPAVRSRSSCSGISEVDKGSSSSIDSAAKSVRLPAVSPIVSVSAVRAVRPFAAGGSARILRDSDADASAAAAGDRPAGRENQTARARRRHWPPAAWTGVRDRARPSWWLCVWAVRSRVEATGGRLLGPISGCWVSVRDGLQIELESLSTSGCSLAFQVIHGQQH